MLMGAGPLAFGVAKGLGLPTKESLAVAASLAPCSTGVALVVLKCVFLFWLTCRSLLALTHALSTLLP